MKLRRLDLRAFGPFTQQVLDFGAAGAGGGANLHLIYGANEAGKSSALRALGDLRFGIPMRSTDNFIHPHPQMRIGAVFEAPPDVSGAGQPLTLLRSKGRGQTLSVADAATGEPLAQQALPAALQRWLTDGLEREPFEAMFSLNHQRLREGGQALIDGQGELGAALFAASAGSQSVRQLLDALDAEARRYHAPRASLSVMAQARHELDEARKALRDSTTRPQAWKDLQHQTEQAAAQLALCQGHLAERRQREAALIELRTVAPLLRRRDQLADQLARLADVPCLPEDAPEQRRTAQRERAAAQEAAREAELEAAHCERELVRLAPDAALLAQAEPIRRLVAELVALQQATEQVEAQDATRQQVAELLQRDAARIAPGLAQAELLQAVPGAAQATAMRARAEQLAEKLQQLAAQQDAVRLREQELAELASASTAPVPAVQLASLHLALAQSRALGDPGPRLQALQRDAELMDARLAQALAELGLADLAALARARLLLDAVVQEARSAHEVLEQERTAIRPERERLVRDLAEQQGRAEQLRASGELVTAATLAEARAQRDAGWQQLRARYIDRAELPAEQRPGVVSASTDMDGPAPTTLSLPAAFERAVQQADHQADLLRLDAARAAQWTDCQTRIHQMQARLAELLALDAALQAEVQQRQTAWQAQLDAAGLPPLSPAALAEWQKAVLALRERAEQLRGTRHDLALLATQSTQARADLRAALDDKSDSGDAGLTIRTAAQLTGTCDAAGADLLARTAAAALAELATHLAALSQQAAVQVQVWEAALAAQQERERQQQLVAPRLDEARRQLVLLQTEVNEGQAACGADAQALWLISPIRSASITSAGEAGAAAVTTIQPAVLRARLDELVEFERRHAEWQRLQLAQQAADVRAARLAQSLAELVLRLGDPAAAASDESARPTRGAVPGLTALGFDASADAIRRYERRLLEAQDAEHQRAVLLRDRVAADERWQRAQARAAAAVQTLQQLCELAAVSEADLPELEAQSAQRRSMESELALVDQQLAQAACRPLDALRVELAGRDLAELDAERQQAEQACAQADAAWQRALGSAQAAQQALDAVDASAQAAEAREAIELAAARWRDAVRPWARLRLAHALLERATRRFRERAQAPMLGAASSLFATMTGGRYVRLRVDDADGRPVLQAERAGDAAKPIGVPALSEGTADQLYLALRLAALGLRHSAEAAAPVMPLVLDDVLMTADDERAACILQALAAHARTGQVLLFTHHRHLIELARERLDGAAFMVHRL